MFMPPLSLACYHVLRPILAKKKRFNGKKKLNNITRGEEKRISKIRKTIRPEWLEVVKGSQRKQMGLRKPQRRK